MSDNQNMRHWMKVHKPPTTVLKKISGGRMNGKNDINPMWRIQAMTELFGPCGVGWRYSIDKLWTEAGGKDEIAAFALVSVSYREGDTWSEPMPGIGGSMFVAQEKNGAFTSDEAYKMAVTDALSVALKALGVAAEIYLGNFDGSKYKDEIATGGKQTQSGPPSQLTVSERIAKCSTLNELASLWKSLPAADQQAHIKVKNDRKDALTKREFSTIRDGIAADAVESSRNG